MPKFRVSLLSLTWQLAVPFAPQAVAKTPTAVTAAQPALASGSAMIVDLAPTQSRDASPRDLVRP
ncbi:D-alanyl-D-alanine endopeptidase, partial [Klebsiella pneumoniae]